MKCDLYAWLVWQQKIFDDSGLGLSVCLFHNWDTQAFNAETRDIRQKMLTKILTGHRSLHIKMQAWNVIFSCVLWLKAKDLWWLWFRPVCSSCGSWAECPPPGRSDSRSPISNPGQFCVSQKVLINLFFSFIYIAQYA